MSDNYNPDDWSKLSREETNKLSTANELKWFYIHILKFIYRPNKQSRETALPVRVLTNSILKCFELESFSKYFTREFIDEQFELAVKYVNNRYNLNIDSDSIKSIYCNLDLLKNKENVMKLLLDNSINQKMRKIIYVTFRK